MATYLKTRNKINPVSYNSDMTDKKVDWILDEVKLEKKIEDYVEVVPPVLTLPDFDITIDADILEMEDAEYELPFDDMEGVSAYDEQAGDLTSQVEVTYFANGEETDPVTFANVDFAVAPYTLLYSTEDGAGNTVEVERLVTFTNNTLKLDLLAPVEGDTAVLRLRKAQVDKLLTPGNSLTFTAGVTEVLYGTDRFVVTGISSVDVEGTITVTLSLESLEDGVTQDTIDIVTSEVLDTDFYGATVTTATPNLPQVIKATFSQEQQ